MCVFTNNIPVNRLQSHVVFCRRYDERGMLDIEFHPNYQTNGRFYLYYTIARSFRNYVRISEMRVRMMVPLDPGG